MLGLLQGVLAGRAIEHQQHFMWRVQEVTFCTRAADLGLVRPSGSALLCRRPAVSIRYDIGPAGNSALHGIKGNGGRVGTHGLLYDGNAGALAPDRELLNCRRAKRVGRAEQNAVSLLF
jgi:hypothetical protein